MRLVAILLLLALAAPCNANPLLFLMQGQPETTELFTINGHDSISIVGTQDTGTDTITTGAGDITIYAGCVGTEDDNATITLTVDGVSTYLGCLYNETKEQTLSRTVTAGDHTVRVQGTHTEGSLQSAYFTAGAFRKPKVLP